MNKNDVKATILLLKELLEHYKGDADFLKRHNDFLKKHGFDLERPETLKSFDWWEYDEDVAYQRPEHWI